MQGQPTAEHRSGSHWPAWTALVVALSPAIADALRLGVDRWWGRPALWMAAVAIGCVATAPHATPALGAATRRAGIALVALGVAAALLATAGGMVRLGRPAVPIAVLGMAWILGRPDPRRAALFFFAVAPPRALMEALPGLHTWVGPAWADAPDGGLPLLWLWAGMGVWAGVRRGDAPAAILRRGALFGLAALPVQGAGLAAAAGLERAGHPDAARWLLSHALWIGSALGLWGWIRLGADAGRGGGAGPSA